MFYRSGNGHMQKVSARGSESRFCNSQASSLSRRTDFLSLTSFRTVPL